MRGWRERTPTTRLRLTGCEGNYADLRMAGILSSARMRSRRTRTELWRVDLKTRPAPALWRANSADLEDAPAQVTTRAARYKRGYRHVLPGCPGPGDTAGLMRTSRTRPEAKKDEPQKCLAVTGVLPLVSRLFPGRT
jgi:hypothetical protein